MLRAVPIFCYHNDHPPTRRRILDLPVWVGFSTARFPLAAMLSAVEKSYAADKGKCWLMSVRFTWQLQCEPAYS